MTEPNEDDLLRSVLAVSPLNPESKDRMYAAVEREWRAATPGANGRAGNTAVPVRRFRVLAVAAVLAAVGVTVWVARPPLAAPAIGSLSRLDGRELSVTYGLFQRRNLQSGDSLRIGDRLTTDGPARVALARGGTLRIAAGSTVQVTGRRRLSLQRGLIYVDIPPGLPAEEPLRVDTRAGSVEHVGTEFEVLTDDRAVRVRVREGRIRFLGKTDTVLADAGTELLVTPGKAIAQRSIDTFGGDWSWTTALAPDYDIEGRPLIGFLQWVSRELGRPLDFADANARKIADRTILHGSVRHQAPMDAMSNVLATTSLKYEIRGDTIWVRSGAATAL